MLKIMVKIIVGTLILLLLACLALQMDDELDEDQISFMKLSETPAQSDAYFYLLGLAVDKNKDPISEGKKLYEGIKLIENHNQRANYLDQKPIQLMLDKSIFPEDELLCSVGQSECMTVIDNNLDRIPQLLSKNTLFIKRYQTFLHLDDYHTLTQPSVDEPFPPYEYLSMATRIINLQQIWQASQGKQAQAINALYQSHEQLRKLLTKQDMLIGKLIVLNLLSENIDAINLLAMTHNLTLSTPLLLLTKQDRSLVNSFSRDARGGYQLYSKLDRAENIFSSNLSSPHIPSWVTRILYKPNMTTNQSNKWYLYFAMLSELPANEFVQEVQLSDRIPAIKTHWIRNSIGTVLSQVSVPNYQEYIADFWDMDSKIQLFNAALNNNEISDIIDTTKSIYADQKNIAPYLSEDKKQLCFDSPIHSEPKYNCLKIKL
ncbi:hypothetical protein ACR30L_19765 [Psychromonas sp. PT13]|uniref:hypothetical protein n=1 Tax=Psychromonas sp. PT13 TaxID=3439547 RepID=UPI003EC129AE